MAKSKKAKSKKQKGLNTNALQLPFSPKNATRNKVILGEDPGDESIHGLVEN